MLKKTKKTIFIVNEFKTYNSFAFLCVTIIIFRMFYPKLRTSEFVMHNYPDLSIALVLQDTNDCLIFQGFLLYNLVIVAAS